MRLKKNNKRKTHCLKNWQNKRLHGKLKRYNKKILTRPFSWETSEFLNLKPKSKQILRQVVTSHVILKFKFPSCYWVFYNLGALYRLLPTKCNETFFPANCQKRNLWRKLNVKKIPSRNETRRKKKQRVGKLTEFHSKISATDKKWEEFALKDRNEPSRLLLASFLKILAGTSPSLSSVKLQTYRQFLSCFLLDTRYTTSPFFTERWSLSLDLKSSSTTKRSLVRCK